MKRLVWLLVGFAGGFALARVVMESSSPPGPVVLEEVELDEDLYPHPPAEWGEEAQDNPDILTFRADDSPPTPDDWLRPEDG